MGPHVYPSPPSRCLFVMQGGLDKIFSGAKAAEEAAQKEAAAAAAAAGAGAEPSAGAAGDDLYIGFAKGDYAPRCATLSPARFMPCQIVIASLVCLCR